MSKSVPKKFEIKPPQMCQCCDNAGDCAFLKQLYEKPFDASSILLNCKAFYIVFCELEERCRIPYGDPETMMEKCEETDARKRPYLDPAMITNGVLAAELALKALTLRETGTFECIHDINKLFYNLPSVHKTALSNLLNMKTCQNDTTLKKNLEIISNFFQKWRYFFEYDSIGYSGFLLAFIHIVCDYAIVELGHSSF